MRSTRRWQQTEVQPDGRVAIESAHQTLTAPTSTPDSVTHRLGRRVEILAKRTTEAADRFVVFISSPV
jgi:hypothetical protein